MVTGNVASACDRDLSMETRVRDFPRDRQAQ
jgi:hypothetical protein